MNPRAHDAARLACGLAGDVAHTFGRIRLRVFGASMVPSILPGDLITVQRVPVSEISNGEVVLYARYGRMFAHRVVGCTETHERPFAVHGESLLITRGDLLAHNDPPVSSNELLGKVISIHRGDRKVKTTSPAGGFTRALVLLLRASSRATYLYVKLATFWWKLASRTFLGRRKNEASSACAKIEDPRAVEASTCGPEIISHCKVDARLRPLETEGAIKCQS